MREGAVRTLAGLAISRDPRVAISALNALKEIAKEDDSKRVAALAAEAVRTAEAVETKPTDAATNLVNPGGPTAAEPAGIYASLPETPAPKPLTVQSIPEDKPKASKAGAKAHSDVAVWNIIVGIGALHILSGLLGLGLGVVLMVSTPQGALVITGVVSIVLSIWQLLMGVGLLRRTMRGYRHAIAFSIVAMCWSLVLALLTNLSGSDTVASIVFFAIPSLVVASPC